MTNEKAWEIIFKADIIAVEKNRDNGFEHAVRAPGVRVILRNDAGEILLTNEFRPEHKKRDFRLPGGKVLDGKIDAYLKIRGNAEALEKAAMEAGKIEAKEEAGVEEIDELSLYAKSVESTTVEYDLYYFTGRVLKMGAPELHQDEKFDGMEVGFYGKDKVLRMIRSQEIAEDRTAAVLYRYLASE